MKNFLMGMVVLLSIMSCKTNPQTALDKKAQVTIKGNWQITKVSYVGQEYFKVNAFQIADSQCFVGSQWFFISNNNKGSLNLKDTKCANFSSDIVWSVNQEGMFGLKILNAGLKAQKVKEGYFLKLANQTETSFQLIDKMDVGGKLSDIVYQFEKIQ